MRTYRNYRLCIWIFLISLCCWSCSSRDAGDAGYFCYNESTGIASLDPAFAKNQSIMWAVHQLYNTLVEVDSNLQIKPSLAIRWEISEDGLVYRFFLRPDVVFHDDPCFPGGKGRRMLASDVVYSLQRIMNPATASSGAWIFNDRVKEKDGFLAVNDTLLEVHLIAPFPPILGILSMQYCSVLPKEAVDFYGPDFRSHPVGTGPFQFVALEEGQALLMKRNSSYFETDERGRQLPYLHGIKISFNDSKATEFLLFRQGKLHFVNDIDASFKDEILTKTGLLRKDWEGKITLNKHAYLNIEYLGILVDSNNALVKVSPLRLKAIRQALNYGFDRRKLMLYLRNSIGIAAESGFVPAGLPSFDSLEVRGYRFDPIKAQKLLEEAGFPGGKGLPEIRLLTVPIYSELASYIVREWQELGIPVKVEVVQKSFLLEQTAQSQALFFRGSWIADYPDAENYLSVFYGKNPAPPNYTRYNNPAFDRLYEKALTETNDSLRFELYRQMDRMILEDAPVVPLWYDEAIHLVQPFVKNFEPNSLNLLELRRVEINEN
ncbi:ABC transporter substrate-binding protein [Flavihumibacter sp. RY-1]|uniref:ABC transporter substrate-binding protein n=1 Tax=Flavihumibacter fluminis TaxID=2909236 RepID=A0ABS9BJ23_9BACT|nr:ABC transporter substrate-binding protein [Flavihumibacter fluminis]MCF1714819.1 ABC transporter substrate-binding protein [Flavihumibacter fluminis]